jgi:hypothetical protein
MWTRFHQFQWHAISSWYAISYLHSRKVSHESSLTIFILFPFKDKRVCDQVNTFNTPVLFDTLTPGMCFVSPYGIVEVVSDDRAIPFNTAVSGNQIDASANLKKQVKLYQSALYKHEAREQKNMMNISIMSYVRRLLLRRLYDDYRSDFKVVGSASAYADAIRNVYSTFGSAPLPGTIASKRKELIDPAAPADSFPDRIVECILIPDQRSRYIGHCKKDDSSCLNFTLLEGLGQAYFDSNRIFLQRRLLTIPYCVDSERYHCPACYQCFASKPGYKYHVDTESCIKKASSRASALQERQLAVESKAQQIVDRCNIISSRVCDQSETINETQSHEPLFERGNTQQIHRDESTEPEVDAVDAQIDSLQLPDLVLAQLYSELYRALGQTIGPMYPEVWKALGYKKPSKKVVKQNKSVVQATNTNEAKKTILDKSTATSANIASYKAASIAKPVPTLISKPTLPSLSIIDIHPLVQEIDAGRYPSMKRYGSNGEDDRDANCAICKQVDPPVPVTIKGDHCEHEDLKPCNFCRQVEHYSCAITKFAIKYPESCDDFMCHNCIGVVSTRRSRAERRRLEKLRSLNKDKTTMEATTFQQDVVNLTKQQEIVELSNGIVHGREYECVATQGRRLDDLNILLRDSKARLSLLLDVDELYQNRQSLIDTMFNE